MRLNNDYDDSGKSKTIAAICCITAIVTVIVIVLLMNKDQIVRENTSATPDPLQSKIDELKAADAKDPLLSFSLDDSTGLTVSDLDFYNMYPKDEDQTSVSEEKPEEKQDPQEEINETNDGKHTRILYEDGKEEWVAISQILPKNEYDFTNLVDQSGKMKYFEKGRCTSFLGVDISKDQGYVDFVKLLKAGVNFVMIRVGQRGYQTGQITEDEYFADNIKRATDAGLAVGVYFLSQAITADEAKQEADFVLEKIGDYRLKYPIAFVMKYAKGDSSRVEPLSKNEKTTIAKTFLSTVAGKGYKTAVYGNKAWLLKNVDLSKLIEDYDVWYSEMGAGMPDFPYSFDMWQYSGTGSIDGIAGYVNMNICFVDYSLK